MVHGPAGAGIGAEQMTINGLDISLYQETDTKFIDWPALKADPLNFRFIWIKCQEGTYLPTDAGGYNQAIVKRQIAGAQSVGFEAINLYHFYYFQLKFLINGVWTWKVLTPASLAVAFHQTYLASGLKIAHPMTDMEDPLIMQFLPWTTDPNKALSFARALNAHMKEYHQRLTDLFSVRPDIYTGKWWLDWFIPQVKYYYPAETEWIKDYNFILADYDGTFTMPAYLTLEQVIAWQWTSTPTPPVKGIPTGRIVPGDALDCDRWMRTDADFDKWSGNATTPPPPTDLVERIKLLEANDKAQDARLTKLEAGLGRLVEIGDYVITQIKAFIAWLG